MKVLHVTELYFLLPDDFAGTRADALRLLAEHHASEGTLAEEPPDLGGAASRWQRFLLLVDRGYRTLGGAVVECDDGGEWRHVTDPVTGEAIR